MLWLSHLDLFLNLYLIELFILLSIEIVFALIEPFGSWITKRKREMANRDTHRMQPPLISIRSAVFLYFFVFLLFCFFCIFAIFVFSLYCIFVFVTWTGLMCHIKFRWIWKENAYWIFFIRFEVVLENFTLLWKVLVSFLWKMTDPLLPNLQQKMQLLTDNARRMHLPQLEMHYRNRGLQDTSGRLPLQRCIRLVSVCRTPLDGLSGWVGGDYHPQDISILCKKCKQGLFALQNKSPCPFTA